jgi:hypothetical protein
MVKNIKKNNGKPNKKLTGLSKKRANRPYPGNSYRDAVLRMWADPCAATPVRPPYAGMDSGYMIRTVDEYPVIGLANVQYADVMFQWTPSNYGTGTGYVTGFTAAGTTATLSATMGPGNFIVETGVVRDFRPAASCVEWVPNGPIATRSGTVSRCYSPTTVLVGGELISASGVAPICQISDSNSTAVYEANWLPTQVDERFTTVTEGNLSGRGTVLFLLRNVDCTSGTASSTVNGYFRVTTIWEWTPATPFGVSSDPVVPPPTTTQQILGGVKNIRDIIYGAMKVGQMMGVGFGANSGPRTSYNRFLTG